MRLCRLLLPALALLAVAFLADARQGQPLAKDLSGDLLPPGAIARFGTTRWRHDRAVAFAAFLPDGKSVITVGDDVTIRLWDFPSGKELRRIAQPAAEDAILSPGFRQSYFAAAALSPDGKTIAACFNNSVIFLFDVASGKELPRLQRESKAFSFSGPCSLVFSHGGKELAALDGDDICIWDWANAKEIRRFAGPGNPHSRPRSIVYAPDGKSIAAFDYGRQEGKHFLKRWNPATGAEIAPLVKDFEVWTRTPAYSPDGKTIALSNSNGITLLDAATGKPVRELKGKGNPANTLIFSKDGSKIYGDGDRFIYGDTDRFVQEWDIPTGTLVRKLAAGRPNEGFFRQPAGIWPSIALSPDGKTIVAAGFQHAPQFIDIASGKDIPMPAGHAKSIVGLQFTPDGKNLLTQDFDSFVRKWDVSGAKDLGAIPLPARSDQVALAPNSRFLAARSYANKGHAVTVIDAITAREVAKIVGGESGPIVFSPVSNLLAVQSRTDQIIKLHELISGKLLHTLHSTPDAPKKGNFGGREIDDYLLTMVFSPDGKMLVSFADVDILVFWDTATGKQLGKLLLLADDGQPTTARLSAEGIRPIQVPVFSRDGRCLAFDRRDGSVTVFELATLQVRQNYGTKKSAPDDKKKAGANKGALYFGMHTLLGYNGPSAGPRLAFSPDGRFLAQAKNDQCVHLWNLMTGDDLAVFKGHTGAVTALAFAPDGKSVASASWDTTALLWDVSEITQPPAADKRLQPGELETRWETLAHGDAGKAFSAICDLTAAPKDAVAFIKERLKPVAAAPAKRIEELIQQLDDDKFQVRDKATSELLKIGEQIVPALDRALAANSPLETKQRLAQLRAKLTGMILQGERLRAYRAIEILERLGTPESRQVLESIAAGAPGGLVTVSAQAALKRL